MKVKRFEDFLKKNEAIVDIKEIESKVDDLYDSNEIIYEDKIFLHKFNQVIEDLSSFRSFSDMAKEGSLDVTFDYADSEIESSLSQFKLSLDECRKKSNIIFKNIESYDSINGMVDILLYKINPNYKLGGLFMDHLTSDEKINEFFIRYSYGYHKTNYGRIFLEQNFGDVDKFLDEFRSRILYLFIIDTDTVYDQKFIIEEIKDENFLTNLRNNKLRVFFKVFYDLVKTEIIGLEQHDTSYETYKKFFINWVESKYKDIDKIVDLDNEINIFF